MMGEMILLGFCCDCFELVMGWVECCKVCGSLCLMWYCELNEFYFVYIDCDVFYVLVEKCDNFDFVDKLVIIGGGKCGVVLICCYIVCICGVCFVMLMFKVFEVCLEVIVIRLDMEKYSWVGCQICQMMQELIFFVEFLLIDEVFFDFKGIELIYYYEFFVWFLVWFVWWVEDEVGVMVLVGFFYCKFFVKVVFDMCKLCGMSVIGCEEVLFFLVLKLVMLIWGVGCVFVEKLVEDGICEIGQFQQMDEVIFMCCYGMMGQRFFRLVCGLDEWQVYSDGEVKSVLVEMIFFDDIFDFDVFVVYLCVFLEKVLCWFKCGGFVGQIVVFKMKIYDFKMCLCNVSFESFM